MRICVRAIAAVLLATCAPTAAAEGELVVSVDADLEPFTFSEQRGTVLVDVDCGVFAGVPPTITVELVVVDAPAWLNVGFESPTLSASPTQCPAARTTLETELRLYWQPSEGTPEAGDPYPFRVRAHASDLRGNAFEAMSEDLVARAGLRGTLRVTPGESPMFVTAGQFATFTRDVVNDYNARVQVEFLPDADAAARGVGPVTRTVAPESRTPFAFTVRVPPEMRPPQTFEVRLPWTAAYNGSPLHAGVENVSFTVVDPTFLEGPPTFPTGFGLPEAVPGPTPATPAGTPAPTTTEEENPLPAPATALALGVLVLVALGRRARSAR